MTAREFSDQFDVLYNNITSNQAPGLNEYEKSVFLTKAQEELLKNYFNPKGNPKGDGFDSTAKRQADFSSIIRASDMTPVSADVIGLDRRAKGRYIYTYPNDMFIILNEQIYDTKTQYVVKPIDYQEYDKLMSRPYKFPPKYQAWRLISGLTSDRKSVTYTREVTKYRTETRDKTTTKYSTIPGTATALIGESGITFIYCNSSTAGGYAISGMIATEDSTSIGSDVDGLIIYVNNNVKIKNLETAINQALSSSNIPEAAFITVSGFESIDSAYMEQTLAQLGFIENDSLNESISIPKATISSADITETYTEQVPYTDIETITTYIESGTPIVELIGIFDTGFTYSVRYIKRPMPIILTDFSSQGLSINGKDGSEDFYNGLTCCELPEQLHDEILQRAIELAKVAWAGTQEQLAATNMSVTSGQRSE